MNCRVCGSAAEAFATALVLGRHAVRYFQCRSCRYVQTEAPYWLEEAYTTSQAAADVGAVERNLRFAGITQTVIQQFSDPDGRFLDYGGGPGLFVRLMRDRGFDFRWRDKHAANMYALGFEAHERDAGFALVTAFEVVEHLVDPMAELEAMLARGRGLLFATELLPARNPKPGEWWYYAPSAGQHIGIFTLDALRYMAARFGRHLATNGRSLHLMSDRPVSSAFFRRVTKPRTSRALNWLRRRPSLVASDFEAITGARLK